MSQYKVARDNVEIDSLLNACFDAENTGKTKYRGMTYEQGIRAGVSWVVGLDDEHPLDDGDDLDESE